MLLDAHATGVPAQSPFWHLSPVVHAFPSSQRSEFGRNEQPVTGLQSPVRQTFAETHVTAAVPAQATPEQTSPDVHALLSLQGRLFGTNEQEPEWASQIPERQVFEDVHGFGVPVQTPPEQTSLMVHAFPSSHARLFGISEQEPELALQTPV